MKEHLPVLNKRAASTCYLNLSPLLNFVYKKKRKVCFHWHCCEIIVVQECFIDYQQFLRYGILEPNPGFRSLRTTKSLIILLNND